MRYEPVKESLNRIFRQPLMRRLFYLLLDLLLLRAWHIKRALKKIASQLPSDANVLDAGSGLGQYVWRMARKNRGWKITGIDINRDQVADSAQFFNKMGYSGRIGFKVADLTDFKEVGSYNFILSVDVMEHILEDEKVFRNFYDSMRNNGILMISTPSDMGGSDVHNNHHESFIEEHVRDGYSKFGITEKLGKAGFRDIKVKYTYGTPGKISWFLSMKIPLTLLGVTKLSYIVLPLYYIAVLPFCFILNGLDMWTDHNTGTGLLVLARKKV
jgi:SAM-dependent methyltransferase